ncbi:MAG: ATP-binding protein [Clostridia bacterium]|nr:ATP-binding protein [Clostridia bacterium]
MLTTVEIAARQLRMADDAGHGLIVLDCEDEADARRTVEQWPYRSHRKKTEVMTADAAPFTERAYAVNMLEVTPRGAFVHFDEAFSWQAHGTRHEGSLMPVLSEMTDARRYEHTLVYIKDSVWLDPEPGAMPYRDQIVDLIRLICRQKREGTSRAVIVVRSADGRMPSALRALAYFIRVHCPTSQELSQIIEDACRGYAPDTPLAPALNRELAERLRGFRRDAVEDLIRMAFTRYEHPTAGNAHLLFQEADLAKRQFIQGCRGLYWLDASGAGLAGNRRLVQWLQRRAVLFRQPYAARRLQACPPRGIILCGLPGSGKTCAARAAAHMLGEEGRPLPLIQLSISAMLDRYMGTAETTLETALRTLNSLSPAVIVLDEAEKTFGDVNGPQTHEVIRRMFSRLLQWMQDEKEDGLFLIATANHLDRVPTEFQRKGRVDEVFFTGLPSLGECRAILALYMDRKKELVCLPADTVWETERERIIQAVLLACAKLGRFMNGADMEELVKQAFDRLFYENCDRLEQELKAFPETGTRPVYSLDAVEAAMLSSLRETRSYFETNMDAAAHSFWEMYSGGYMDTCGAPFPGEDEGAWTVLPAEGELFDPETGALNRNVFREKGLLNTSVSDQTTDAAFVHAQAEAAGKAGDYNGAFRWALVKSLLRLRKA